MITNIARSMSITAKDTTRKCFGFRRILTTQNARQIRKLATIVAIIMMAIIMAYTNVDDFIDWFVIRFLLHALHSILCIQSLLEPTIGSLIITFDWKTLTFLNYKFIPILIDKIGYCVFISIFIWRSKNWNTSLSCLRHSSNKRLQI